MVERRREQAAEGNNCPPRRPRHESERRGVIPLPRRGARQGGVVMTGPELSRRLGVSSRYLSRLAQQARRAGRREIHYQGARFAFAQAPGIGGRGQVYAYTPLDPAPNPAAPPGRRQPCEVTLNPAELPQVRRLAQPTLEEKQALVVYCRASRLSYAAIAKGLICQHEAFATVATASLARRLKRWAAAYQAGGRAALADKRGRKATGVDMARVKKVVYACGTKHYTSQYFYYCYLWAKAQRRRVNLRDPKADIHYTTFVRAVQKLTREDQQLRDYLRIGLDAFTYAEPSVGRDWWHANQQWEIDATKQDILVKVPIRPAPDRAPALNCGMRDYWRTEPSAAYHQVRMQIIGVVDNCTGATVYGLYSASNYYGNARLLYKAIQRLGRPEQLRGDQGADFMSRDFQRLLHELGLPYIKTQKGRADQKGTIERTFKIIQHSREFESLAGFIGHDVAQRQHLENEASTKLERLSGVATNIKGDLMWWWEFENWLDNYLQHTQASRYAQHTPLPEADLTELFRQLGQRRFCKVAKGGLYHRRQYYFSSALWEHVQIGEQVELIEHIDDSRRLFVFRDGQYLCEVMEKGEYQAGVSIEEIKQLKKSYRQRVVAQDRALAKKARREYRGFQNAMRDEFISIETRKAELKAADPYRDVGGRLQDVGDRAASGTSGRRAAPGAKAEAGNDFDALSELRRYALGGAE